MLCIPALMVAACLYAAEPAPPAFTIHLPAVKVGWPDAQYWAEIECPNGESIWAWAIYTGGDSWTVPFHTEVAGVHRLRRVEKRFRDKTDGPVEFTPASQTEVEVDLPSPRAPRKPDEKPLLEVGEFKTFFAAQEPWCVNDHTLVQDPNRQWHLFGITHEKPFNYAKDPATRLAHATSDTLLNEHWTAHPPTIVADWNQYREWLLWAPHIVHHNNLYYMFVCAGDDDSHNYRLHLMTSPDLETWTRHPDNPITIDGFDGRDPMVIRAGNQWMLYYTANSRPEGGNHIVVCMTSDDLVHWSNRQVAFVHPDAGTFGGPTESPFVVRRGRSYYLFACDNQYTDVYLSNDPFHWDYDRKVARFKAHACEIVRDERGKWYVTHAGWEQGPLKMAPLKWNDDLDETPTSLAPAMPERKSAAPRSQPAES